MPFTFNEEEIPPLFLSYSLRRIHYRPVTRKNILSLSNTYRYIQ